MSEKQFNLRREALFSVLVRRIIGPCFFAGSIVIGGYSVVALVTDGTVLVDGQPTNDWVFLAISILLPAIIAILGLLLFRAKPHYIDE